MSKTVLWIFGLLPAVVMLLYSSVVTIAVLPLFFSTPLSVLIPLAFSVTSIWGTSTVILVILGRPVVYRQYGLCAAIISPLLFALDGLQGVSSLSGFVVLLGSLSLVTVTIYLLRTNRRVDEASATQER